MMNLKPNI